MNAEPFDEYGEPEDEVAESRYAEPESEFDQGISQLVDDLTKMLFVYRMARAAKRNLEAKFTLSELNHPPQEGRYLSAKTRMEQAAREIDDIVRKYVGMPEANKQPWQKSWRKR